MFAYRGLLLSTARGGRKPPTPLAIRLGILLSGLLFCGDMLANHWAVRMTSVANTSLLMNLTPVFVIVIAYLLLRERQSMISVAGVILATAGLIGTATMSFLRWAGRNGQLYSLGGEGTWRLPTGWE